MKNDVFPNTMSLWSNSKDTTSGKIRTARCPLNNKLGAKTYDLPEPHMSDIAPFFSFDSTYFMTKRIRKWYDH
jgi:hypothetical protein